MTDISLPVPLVGETMYIFVYKCERGHRTIVYREYNEGIAIQCPKCARVVQPHRIIKMPASDFYEKARSVSWCRECGGRYWTVIEGPHFCPICGLNSCR